MGNLDSNFASQPPAISVIMAAYNAAGTIESAIRSVLAQTYQDFELVICDDASTDCTISILEGFSDIRIRVIRSEANLGPGPARDRAIQAARGKWVTILDADDQFARQRLEKLISVAERFPNDLIADDIVDCHDTPAGLIPWRTVWDAKRFFPDNLGICEVDFPRFMKEERLLIQPFFLRELALKCGANHGMERNGEDMVFLFPFFKHGSVIRYLPEPLYLYRMTAGSLSTSIPGRHRMYRRIFEEAQSAFSNDFAATAAIQKRIIDLRRLEIYYAFLGALKKGNFRPAWYDFRENPWVITELVKRIFSRVPFHIHRRLNGGARRRVE